MCTMSCTSRVPTTCSYHLFHMDQSCTVQTYPEMVEEEVQRYDNAVCKFFSISRSHPDVRSHIAF